MTILVTGGAGYIGSHTCIELIEAGYDVLILDNFCNSKPEVLNRIETICGPPPALVEGDVSDASLLNTVFSQNNIEAVIHFAGYKAVGESVEKPINYYQNNVAASLLLFAAMTEANCKNLVFSSSATVYGDPASLPITEDFPLSATNPYGQSKLMIENILRDISVSDDQWNTAILRYFNPVGAHKSGLIGEDPSGIPNNLMPYVAQIASGKLECLSVFGDDYPTPDGTGVRDYIHVVDLARGHLAALSKITSKESNHQCKEYNLGTGNGNSVLEIVNAFSKISKQQINYKVAPRRAGDIAECYASVTYSKEQLGWQAEHDLTDMISDHWNWQKQNPLGY
ncbi:UDP-glucose 4-epimerase GalE [Aliamphritea ceti]|uniref:UDP-glucose 4-epimerase GalE n=1 Tax=Aliamphritea ceti TaxID=1524258 RepID=UPI0021C29331|nr:UDP-glucose 4-epimerase GalE [Aliamphritea ceti]